MQAQLSQIAPSPPARPAFVRIIAPKLAIGKTFANLQKFFAIPADDPRFSREVDPRKAAPADRRITGASNARTAAPGHGPRAGRCCRSRSVRPGWDACLARGCRRGRD